MVTTETATFPPGPIVDLWRAQNDEHTAKGCKCEIGGYCATMPSLWRAMRDHVEKARETLAREQPARMVCESAFTIPQRHAVDSWAADPDRATRLYTLSFWEADIAAAVCNRMAWDVWEDWEYVDVPATLFDVDDDDFNDLVLPEAL